MRLWFMGSGPFGAFCLGALSGLMPFSRIVTGLPTRAGRGLRESVSPVEARAQELGLEGLCRVGPLLEEEGLLILLREAPPDAIVVADFGQMVREPFLSGPRWGCLNIHPSLLPRWRGAAPVPRSLMNGDAETGVTVFRLTPGMDAGPVLRQRTMSLGMEDSAAGLYPRLAEVGAVLVAEGLGALARGEAHFVEQDHASATLAPKLEKKEFELSWSWPAARIHNAVRALDASGGAFIPLSGKRLKLWRVRPADGSGAPGQVLSLGASGPVAACGEGAVRLEEVQSECKRRTAGSEWARGLRLKAGDVLR